MSNDNVVSIGGAAKAETPEVAPRIPNVFEFYTNTGELLTTATGYLNLAPDFAAVINDENDVIFVVQASGYSYVKNLGAAAKA